MASPQHRIFISHSHIDNGFGSKIAEDLRHALGDEQAVWYDVLGGLHGGESWWEKIVEELTARDIFLLILSPEALNSQWVRREINIAMIEGKYILPVLHRSCAIRADLRTFQIISFLAPKAYQDAFKKSFSHLVCPHPQTSRTHRAQSTCSASQRLRLSPPSADRNSLFRPGLARCHPQSRLSDYPSAR